MNLSQDNRAQIQTELEFLSHHGLITLKPLPLPLYFQVSDSTNFPIFWTTLNVQRYLPQERYQDSFLRDFSLFFSRRNDCGLNTSIGSKAWARAWHRCKNSQHPLNTSHSKGRQQSQQKTSTTPLFYSLIKPKITEHLLFTLFYCPPPHLPFGNHWISS